MYPVIKPSNLKKQIKKALDHHIIRFIKDPNADSGTVCAIGEHWFYFGGLIAEATAPEDYLDIVGINQAADAITETILEFPAENIDEYRYYMQYLHDHLPVDPIWAEIRCNYIDEEDRFWRVDAWETDEETEEGRVIAYIDDLTGRILYTDPRARIDKAAQDLIKETQNRILNNQILITLNAQHVPTLQIRTDKGILTADPETKENTGRDSIFVGCRFDKDNYADLAAVRSDKTIALYLWDNLGYEDYTINSEISEENIEQFLQNKD